MNSESKAVVTKYRPLKLKCVVWATVNMRRKRSQVTLVWHCGCRMQLWERRFMILYEPVLSKQRDMDLKTGAIGVIHCL
jgi:hypothetical protein